MLKPSGTQVAAHARGAPLAPALTCRACKPTQDRNHWMVALTSCKLEPKTTNQPVPAAAPMHAAALRHAARDGGSSITSAPTIQKRSPSSHLQGVQTSPLMTVTKSVATGV